MQLTAVVDVSAYWATRRRPGARVRPAARHGHEQRRRGRAGCDVRERRLAHDPGRAEPGSAAGRLERRLLPERRQRPHPHAPSLLLRDHRRHAPAVDADERHRLRRWRQPDAPLDRALRRRPRRELRRLRRRQAGRHPRLRPDAVHRRPVRPERRALVLDRRGRRERQLEPADLGPPPRPEPRRLDARRGARRTASRPGSASATSLSATRHRHPAP